jgi:hypothetical protein
MTFHFCPEKINRYYHHLSLSLKLFSAPQQSTTTAAECDCLFNPLTADALREMLAPYPAGGLEVCTALRAGEYTKVIDNFEKKSGKVIETFQNIPHDSKNNPSGSATRNPSATQVI